MKPIEEIIAENIRAMRERRGLTQSTLAESAGVSFRTIQQIEYKERKPSLEVLVAIATALEVSVAGLVSEGSQIPAEILQVLEKCNEDELNLVRAICNNFVKNWELLAARDRAQKLGKPAGK